MSFIHKFFEFFNRNNDDLYDDCFTNNIENLDRNSEYYISPYQAFKIAEQSNHLKSDFFRNTNQYISYLDFTDCNVELVDGDNGKKYWLVKITKGKFSSISYNEDDDSTIFSDGRLGKDDFNLLQCLIDVNTGEYIFYPKNIT